MLNKIKTCNINERCFITIYSLSTDYLFAASSLCFRTKFLHGLGFIVVFEVLCVTCGGENLILRQRNLSEQCLFRFVCLNIKIVFTVCAVKRFKDCNTQLDHVELLSVSSD